jgi:hypothetical protein
VIAEKTPVPPATHVFRMLNGTVLEDLRVTTLPVSGSAPGAGVPPAVLLLLHLYASSLYAAQC